ncbi:barstar family protein [Herbaspirillum sp. WGmk3]|uniref:barstar family protein n=1 Tax=unclassified Herbaspirillum TaxID=2624150 RepID=UPI001AE8C60A|nr:MULTISPECIES: barstar family protein [unclassified Herbaspirillum]MBP1316656.1 RNAse (barnase) inhibitor barstar [Herbaspirillum sp. 1130]MCO4855579.1 barstar family protein [Herbaspirillum sp. WGmk3]
MKKIILDCATVETDDDFWSLYCKAVQPEGSNIFGRNLEALWDAVSAGGPGWPGPCQIELMNVDEFAKRNPRLYAGLQRIAKDLPESSCVQIVLTKSLM